MFSSQLPLSASSPAPPWPPLSTQRQDPLRYNICSGPSKSVLSLSDKVHPVLACKALMSCFCPVSSTAPASLQHLPGPSFALPQIPTPGPLHLKFSLLGTSLRYPAVSALSLTSLFQSNLPEAILDGGMQDCEDEVSLVPITAGSSIVQPHYRVDAS